MKTQGSCYCGAVRFEVRAELTGVISCHCRDCQRINGNFNALALAQKADVTITGEDALTWFDTSAESRRSFCSRCGSRMFKDKGTPALLISAGVFEPPLDRPNIKNLHEGSAGTWYTVTPARD